MILEKKDQGLTAFFFSNDLPWLRSPFSMRTFFGVWPLPGVEPNAEKSHFFGTLEWTACGHQSESARRGGFHRRIVT